MGIFGSLFGKKKVTQEEEPSITINEVNAVHEIYKRVFHEEMKNVEGISESDKADILCIINGCEGGFPNLGGYHKRVYESYFKGKSWTWTWYEKWAERFAEFGRYPTGFFVKQVLTKDFVYDLLTVAEYKNALTNKGIAFTSKHKKQDLIELVKQNLKIEDLPLIAQRLSEHSEKEKYELYSILMRTINFRSNHIHTSIRCAKAGIKNVKLMQTHDDHKVFSDMAIKENPRAIPPLYPCDLTWLKPEINF
ncbi:MAG: hypothetical protein Q7T66_04825 [Herminiimonas sp.]|uniref:hypothetical protein n=1 Tax=Herminiimonas sp. TaxID=1926289 RepID=UPI002716294B|nr:hypothetical protein [Herminiimonas sp.]MDO9419969.1 hypothetical protein [Herminiimonas sp.]